MNIKIGETTFKINPLTKLMHNQFAKFSFDGEADISIDIKVMDVFPIALKMPEISTKFYDIYYFDSHFIQIQKNDNGKVIGRICYFEKYAEIDIISTLNIEIVEYLLTEYCLLYYIFKKQKAILIHSSSFIYNDKSVLLVAKSGTGKSTHARLWREKEQVKTINDDKNLILDIDGDLYIYPNPWSGKSLIDSNIIHKLNDIVILSRGITNEANIISKKIGFTYLLPHISNTSFMIQKENWNYVTDLIIKQVKFISLKCNISYDAVDELKIIL